MLKTEECAKVMLQVDRADFCPRPAYWDTPQDIGFNATISAPHMHAYALERAWTNIVRCAGPKRLLDVGSGSGYLTVCFARLLQSAVAPTDLPDSRVVGIEHIPALVRLAAHNTRKHHADLIERGLVRFVQGDGRQGCEGEGPYDFIYVGAASAQVPPALVRQLRPGGLMVIPVGEGVWAQSIRLIYKDQGGRVTEEEDLPVQFVPLTDSKLQWPSEDPE